MLSSTFKKAKISWSVWDFAGEDMYSSTQKIFISERSIFVIVWNMSESPETQVADFDRWIQNIKNLAEDAIIYLVGTHLDKVSSATVSQIRGQIAELYAQKYDGLFAFEVDNKKGKGLEELGKSLTDIASRLPSTGGLCK
jgi:GTPase SAR1 family protein